MFLFGIVSKKLLLMSSAGFSFGPMDKYKIQISIKIKSPPNGFRPKTPTSRKMPMILTANAGIQTMHKPLEEWNKRRNIKHPNRSFNSDLDSNSYVAQLIFTFFCETSKRQDVNWIFRLVQMALIKLRCVCLLPIAPKANKLSITCKCSCFVIGERPWFTIAYKSNAKFLLMTALSFFRQSQKGKKSVSNNNGTNLFRWILQQSARIKAIIVGIFRAATLHSTKWIFHFRSKYFLRILSI